MEIDPKANTSPVASTTGTQKVESEVPAVDLSKFVSVDEFNKVLKRLNDQSAILDEVRKSKVEPTQPKPIADKDFGQKLAEIEVKQKAQDERAISQDNRDISIAFESALKAGGLSEQKAIDLTKLLKTELKISVNDRKVLVKSGESELDAADYIKAFLETDRGREYLTPKLNPKSDMNPGNKQTDGTKPSYTKEQYRTGQWDPNAFKRKVSN